MLALATTGRTLATVLFTDIVGSTRLAAEMGDRRWGELLDAHHAAVRRRIEQSGGTVVSTAGDGFFALFDSPAAAVECSRAVRDTVRELGLEIRAGLHTGECELMGDNVGGLAVHIGARVSAKAGAGQILVSSTVKDLVAGSAILFKDRGSHALKGIPGRWHLYAVADEAPSSSATGTPRTDAAGTKQSQPRPAADRPPLPGRTTELATIEQELDTVAAGTLRVVSVEGEIGIGKSRLLEEIAVAAKEKGFAVATAVGDEEIHGPFLFTRLLLTGLGPLATDAATRRALKRASDAISGGPPPEPSAPGLPAEERLIPVLDTISLAISTIAQRRPLALLVDDLHWADDETMRVLRFVTRFAATSPIAVVLAFEPGGGTAAASFASNVERLRAGQRFPLSRLTSDETQEMMEAILGEPVGTSLARAIHQQSEGVPFNVQELLRSLRDSGGIHVIDGTWTLIPGGETKVPPSVRSLVERRAARLPEATRDALAVAGVLGRQFELKSLATLLVRLAPDRQPISTAHVASLLAPAVDDGIILELPASATHDYRFTHNQLRAVLADALPRTHRPEVHAAIVEMLSGDGADPPADKLAEIAHHARLAGEMATAGRCGLAAAKLALDAQAPEETLRLLAGLPEAALDDEQRTRHLRLRDDALAALGRGTERLPVLDELEVGARASGDESLAIEIDLRRASAARMAGNDDRAAKIARTAREAAASRGDLKTEYAACLELGQALTHNPIGEAFTLPPTEVDLDAALETFSRAAEVAAQAGDDRGVAIAKRELGAVCNGRTKAAFLSWAFTKTVFSMPKEEEWQPIDAILEQGRTVLSEALEIFERLDDRRGVMSTIIAMSYTNWHTGIRHGVAGIMEQIRRLHLRGPNATKSEHLENELYGLFGIHYFARYNYYPDLALDRGHEAYRAARALENRWIEFLVAGGVALTHALLSEPEEADRWLDLARSAAMADPTSIRARRLELWRGIARARSCDVGGAIERFDRAVAAATEQGRAAEACEAAATAALELALASLHPEAGVTGSQALMRAEAFADDALRLAATLPGLHPWTAQSQAVRALALLERGEPELAATTAEAAFWNLEGRVSLSPHLDTRLLILRVKERTGEPDLETYKSQVRDLLQEVVLNILDEGVKRRWLASPLHRLLEEIVGPVPLPAQPSGEGRERLARLSPRESHVLRLLATGMTNREIAAELTVPKAIVDQDVESMFAKLDTPSRASATRFALVEGAV